MAEISLPQEVTSKASLMVVDSDSSARAVTAEALEQKGYAVEQASSGPEALSLLEKTWIDLIVLDTTLSGMTGIEVMRRIRQSRRDLLIVVLTAHATVESAIAAVKADVVDYLLKPCKADDLTLTITRSLEERAQTLRHQRLLSMVSEAMEVLRQSETAKAAPPAPPEVVTPAVAEPAVMSVGTLTLDRQKRIVTLGTNPPKTVELTEGEVSILVTLMGQPNQVFSFNDLAKQALGYENADKWTVENMIRSSVFRLRHKIEPGPDTPCLIRTVRGRGYYFSPA